MNVHQIVDCPQSQIHSSHCIQCACRQLRHVPKNNGGAEDSQVFHAVLVGCFCTLEPAKDLGGYRLLNLLMPGRRAWVVIVPSSLVCGFDDRHGVAVREQGEDEVNGNRVDGVIR